jgi:hypothetical protein
MPQWRSFAYRSFSTRTSCRHTLPITTLIPADLPLSAEEVISSDVYSMGGKTFMSIPVFVYLDFGNRRLAHLRKHEHGIEIELQYSISTLKADRSSMHRIVIYTDKPQVYAPMGVEVVDVGSINQSQFFQNGYVFRLKICTLLDALRRFGGACVFLDSDIFVHPGFSATVSPMMKKGAVLWDVTVRPPVSMFPADLLGYPHKTMHNPSRHSRPDGNSGVIGLHSGWGEPILEDALWLVDEMLARGSTERTLEQSAIFETVWLHGRQAFDSKPWINHYCTNSQKRYMHWQIKRLIKERRRPLPPSEPSILLTASRVKAYQYYWDIKRSVLRLPQH